MIAIPWYLIHYLDAYELFGWSYGIVTFSVLFWQPIAGTIIDRYPRRNILIATSFIEGSLLLLGVWLSQYLDNGLLVLAIFAFSLMIFGFNIHYPNVYAFAQEITDSQNYQRTNSLLEIQGQSTTMLAGFVSIILLEGTTSGVISFLGFDIPFPFQIQAWTLPEIIMLDASTYFLSVMILLFIKHQSKIQNQVITPFKQRLKEGFSYLNQNRNVLSFGTFSYSIFTVVIVYSFMLNASYVENYLELGPETMASCEFIYGLGALSAGLLTSRLSRLGGTFKTIVGFFVVTTIILLLLALTKSAKITFLVSLLLGISNAGTRILRISHLFTLVPNEKIGRTNSIFGMICLLERAMFILLFSIPFFATSAGTPSVYFILAAFVGLSGVFLVRANKNI